MTSRARRWLLALTLPAALSLTGCAVVPAQAQATPAAPVVASGPALWKVADADTTIYLFGTVHALPAGVDWYDGAVAEALTASDELVTEIPRGAIEDAHTQLEFGLRAVLPPGQSMRAMLSPRQRASFEGALTRLDLPLDSFDRFEPWFVGMTLGWLPLMERGYAGASGVEVVIDDKAGAAKQRSALETVEAQIAMFDTMPLKSQIAYLEYTTDNIERVAPQMDAMVAAWARGDAEQLARLMNEGLGNRELARRLLYDRNERWAEWIAARLDAPGTSFLAVGAGHLAGDKSVQTALRKRGVSVIRVQ